MKLSGFNYPRPHSSRLNEWHSIYWRLTTIRSRSKYLTKDWPWHTTFFFARMDVVQSFHLYMYNRESVEEMVRLIRHKVISRCGSFQIKKVYYSIPVLSEGHCWKSVYTFKCYEFLVTPRERNIRNIFM